MSNTLLRTAALTTLLLSVATLTGCQTAPSAPEDEVQVARAPAEIQRMARKNDCFKCHAVTREKDGPSWHSVAEKYRDQAFNTAVGKCTLCMKEQMKTDKDYEQVMMSNDPLLLKELFDQTIYAKQETKYPFQTIYDQLIGILEHSLL